ncbi:MAG: preprotein translocase subunit SecE [bacterium]
MSTAGKKNLTEPGFKESVSNYFKGVKVEWGKITWPDRRQVIVETIVVLLVVFFFVALVSCYDWVFGFLLKLLIPVKT